MLTRCHFVMHQVYILCYGRYRKSHRKLLLPTYQLGTVPWEDVSDCPGLDLNRRIDVRLPCSRPLFEVTTHHAV